MKQWILRPFASDDATVSSLAWTFFVMLLAIDVLMLVFHFMYWYTPLIKSEFFSISRDRGYAEFFQYYKEIWIALLFAWHAWNSREFSYLFWSGVFGYVFIDDFFMLHERIGTALAEQLNVPARLLAVRGDDIGELIFYAVFGTLLLALLGAAFYFGTRAFRRDSIYVVAMLLVFGFFASAVDIVHMMARRTVYFRIFDAVEDGGEMMVMSVIVWFAFLLRARGRDPLDSESGTVSSST